MGSLIPIEVLPAINAALNALAAVLLLIGFIFIRQKKLNAHKYTMLSAFGVSVIFLISYVTYHTLRQMQEGVGHTRWEVDGWLRPTYYAILLSHIFLAAFVPFLAIATIVLALKSKFTAHRRLAKITWPVWMYVSITGVMVYVLLYQVHPRLLASP